MAYDKPGPILHLLGCGNMVVTPYLQKFWDYVQSYVKSGSVWWCFIFACQWHLMGWVWQGQWQSAQSLLMLTPVAPGAVGKMEKIIISPRRLPQSWLCQDQSIAAAVMHSRWWGHAYLGRNGYNKGEVGGQQRHQLEKQKKYNNTLIYSLELEGIFSLPISISQGNCDKGQN